MGADDGTLASRNTKAKEQDYSEDEGEEGSREQSEDEAEPDKEEVTEVRAKVFFFLLLSSFHMLWPLRLLIFNKNIVPRLYM